MDENDQRYDHLQGHPTESVFGAGGFSKYSDTQKKKLKKRGLHPLFITGHTGWTDNMEFAFAHKNELCSPFKKKVHDPNALYDAYDESDDTEENSKSGYLKGVGR